MAKLDPDFAEPTRPGFFESYPHLQPAPAGYFQSAEWLRDEIAGLEGDVEEKEAEVEQIAADIPKLEKKFLILQIEAAQAKLKIIELRAKLQAKTGGAA